MPRVETRKSRNAEEKIKFNFDVPMLNSLIQYTRCEIVPRNDLYNLKKLLEYTDLNMYGYEPQIKSRLSIILSILTSILVKGLDSNDMIRAQLIKDYEEGIQIIDDVGFDRNKLNVSECEFIRNFVIERLQHIEIFKVKDHLVDLLQRIDNKEYILSYYALIQEIKEVMSALLVSLQDEAKGHGLLKEFSFSDQDAVNMLTDIVKKAQLPSAVLQTGIRQLNAILSPGFQGGRLYTILGGSGKFKSGTLLNLADQIRLFNPQLIPYENGLRKTVLFITLENSIEESVERLFDMYSDMDADIRNIDPLEMVEILRREGQFDFNNNGGGIDITFKYAGNLQISTAEIYTMVSDLNNKGKQPICIILDYIKRIDSAHNSNGDERTRLSYVSKELKTIAEDFQIPVITAMQLNRDGNSIIDAAMRENKQDVARFVGTSSIGNAWDIIEDSDWVALINLEMQKSSQQLYLTFKRLKIRGKKIPAVSDYFNHPFANAKNIRLRPDVMEPKPLSIISLSTDLESIEEDDDKENEVNIKYRNINSSNAERRSSTAILSTLKSVVPGSMLD